MKFTPNLVSTIIPVHNRAKLVLEAVNSVLEQTHPLVECIVVDDGSTDDTLSILDQLTLGREERVIVIRKENTGPGFSREVGRHVARGEFIQYLDSDDVLSPDKFAVQIAELRANPEAALCYGVTEYHRLNDKDNREIFAATDTPIDRIFPASLVRRRWGTSTPLYRRKIVEEIGGWGWMWSEEDWEYDCRIGALGLPIAYVNSVVSTQRGLVGKRLSQQGRDDQRTLASQAEARTRILGHALQAGVAIGGAEFEHFLRSLFMLARDCGGTGLGTQADRLCELVVINTSHKGLARSARIYRYLAKVAGWERVSDLARLAERIR